MAPRDAIHEYSEEREGSSWEGIDDTSRPGSKRSSEPLIFRCYLSNLLVWFFFYAYQEAGVARKSFLSELLDDYETKGTYDKEHEEDIAAMGGIIFIGKLLFPVIRIRVSNDR